LYEADRCKKVIYRKKNIHEDWIFELLLALAKIRRTGSKRATNDETSNGEFSL
jgi:hypothetical protein